MTQKMIVVADALNLRSSPSVTSAKVGRKVRGDLIELIEAAPTYAGGYAWRETVDHQWAAEGLVTSQVVTTHTFTDRYLAVAPLPLPDPDPGPGPLPPAPPVPVDPTQLHLTWPCGRRPCKILSKFGEHRDTFDHEGVDIRAHLGDTVYACADGIVQFVASPEKPNAMYGCYILLRHEVSDRTYLTYYCHLSNVLPRSKLGRKWQVGDVVKAGDPIGLAGSTGNSTAAHLHLTLQEAGNQTKLRGIALIGCIDPELFLNWPDNKDDFIP